VPLAGVRRNPDPDQDLRASFTELFFDLVFVLVITRLSAILVEDLSLLGAAKTLFLLLVAWWAWLYTTWTTNWFDPDAGAMRTVLFIGMLASMLGAIALPEAFGDRALLFVAGYVAIQTFRNAFAVLASDEDDRLHRPLVRVLIWNAWVGLLWLAGALATDDTRIAIWIVALLADYGGPLAGHWTPTLGRTAPRDWELAPSHFVERIELFIIIALGETIVAAGVTASELDLTTGRVLAVIVGFCVTVALWWLYFAFHAERTLQRLVDAEDERGRIAVELSYLHIPLIAGIVVTAVATEVVTAHPDEPLSGPEAFTLGAGPVLYLLGSALFKARILEARYLQRVAAAAFVAAVAVTGATELPALAIWAFALAALTTVALVEEAERRIDARPVAGPRESPASG
jgi:low temperature requirement protein LtrA